MTKESKEIKDKKSFLSKEIDWFSMIVPLVLVVAICIWIFLSPRQSEIVIQTVRGFFSDDLGIIYAVVGLGMFLCTMFVAFSKFGNIKLGKADEKPQYSSFSWGVMIFTATMAADTLFYSLCEWALYANEPYIEELGGIQKWASTYPLFHWGPIGWSFYIMVGACFGFMLHVRGREKQKFSEGCRPIMGNKVDGIWGKIVNVIAIFALVAGTATSFSMSTPLLSRALSRVFGFEEGTGLSIVVLLVIGFVYTFTVLFGMKGVQKLASYCSYLFFALLLYFLIGGKEFTYIVETGFSALGNMVQNFIGMSTNIDPLRENMFAQNWTIYYWAYWLTCCAATPFFIGKISKGRTIKNTILGAYAWGLAGTFLSFIILGNYGMAQQLKHGVDISGMIAETGDYSGAILRIFDTMPLANVGLILLVVTMITFYATTLDALTMVISSYSYKKLRGEKEPHKGVRIFWAVVYIVFPIALIFAENSLYSLQSVSVISAFPMGIVVIMVIVSFFKDAKSFLEERKQKISKVEDE